MNNNNSKEYRESNQKKKLEDNSKDRDRIFSGDDSPS